MNNVAFARESVRGVWPELQALLQANYAETGALRGAEFRPNVEHYLQMEAAGVTRVFTARDRDEKLFGYASFLVVKHPHYPETLWAMQDALFVQPEKRGPAAVKFLEWTDDELRSEGVDIVYRHVTRKLDFSRTLDRMGYEPVETSFMRRL